MSTVPLVAQLDERSAACGELWSLYRAHDLTWRIQMGQQGHASQDPSARNVAGTTIEAALQAALDSPRLPVVPPKPHIHTQAGWTPKKGDRYWHLIDCAGRPGVGGWKTRREAEEGNARLAALSLQRLDEWQARWGELVRTGTEGVDFRWGRL